VTPESKGPFAGDAADYSFNVYRDATLKTRVGTALFTCQYNFSKNAFCDVSFQLKSGTMIANGAFNFDVSHFALDVTGGDGAYSDAGGEVEVSPSADHAQRLIFQLG
jgi:hypothetical protein